MTIFKIPRTFTLKANSVRATKQFISRFIDEKKYPWKFWHL